MEGIAGTEKVPDEWLKASKTPDVLPGYFNIYMPASAGNTYVGLQSTATWEEGIAQLLSAELKKGKYYSISFDLAFTAVYGELDESYGSMAIYGGNSVSDKAELLWESGRFTYTGWKRNTAVFTPSKNYSYISFWANYDSAMSDGGVAILLDNFSSSIIEGLHITLKAFPTCPNSHTGKVIANIAGLSGRYKYRWKPGNDSSKQVANLAAGAYKLVVKSAEGLTDSAEITVPVSDLDLKVDILSSRCNGDNTNGIIANASGGMSPYLYYLNDDRNGRSVAVFDNLAAGNYSLMIKDLAGCTNKVENIVLTDPDPIRLNQVLVSSVSCADVANGKIILSASGGTPPYTYSIPGYKSQSDSIFRQLDARQYHYRITDSQDCNIDGDVTVMKEWRECAIFVPNAFSPNGDGVNDVFRAKINDGVSDFRMAVYGRWGQLIFETLDPNRGWDGKQKGIDQPTGSYLYVITFTDGKAQARKEQGTLLLIR
ncbi:gliding motility-associated C-terminal domain-containing protein [Chitinophaga sp. CF118]|uniref:T9SS type B sorting domain-containing protein n=1 Tax=Chitinophaga sp. CF118 TaxID=1884367 RepID=UPI0015A6ABD3|nr:gliding motility-associated C-terminal domain-containing protein [Chitinophaga sp. CF118]